MKTKYDAPKTFSITPSAKTASITAPKLDRKSLQVSVGNGFVCVGVHMLSAGHLGEAVVAVAPLRAVGEIHLRPAVRHVVNIFDGMDFATWHWSESSSRDLAWRDVQQMLLLSGLNCPELSAIVQFGFCLSGLPKTAVSVCFLPSVGIYP